MNNKTKVKNITNNKTKRKYKFKSEKRKKKILSIVFSIIGIILILVGLWLCGIITYNFIHNSTEGIHKQAYFGPINLEYASANNNIIMNNKNYTKNNYITESMVENNTIYGSNSGSGQVNIKISFPEYLTKNSIQFYKTRPYFRIVGKYYKLVSYNSNNTKLSETNCKLITSTNPVISTAKINIGEGYYKVQVYSTSNCEGQIYTSKKTVNFATIPKISAKFNNANISSDNPVSINKKGIYDTSFTIKSETNETLYYRWFTYSTYSWDSFNYQDETCKSFNKTVTTKQGEHQLSISEDLPQRMGYLRVYRSKDLCTNDTKAKYTNKYNDNGSDYKYITSFIVKAKYTGAKSFSSSNVTVSYKDKGTTGITKNLEYTIKNSNSKAVYYKWKTYANGILSWDEGKCLTAGASKTITGKVTLEIISNRYGIIYIYSDSKCTKQLKQQKTEVYSRNSSANISGKWTKVSYDYNSIKKNIGSQAGSDRCYDFAAMYGAYIITGKIVSENVKYAAARERCATNGAATTKEALNKVIMENIDKNLPVVVHTNSSSGQHWVTVVGYNNTKNYKDWGINDLWVLDPYNMANNVMSKTTVIKYPRWTSNLGYRFNYWDFKNKEFDKCK